MSPVLPPPPSTGSETDSETIVEPEALIEEARRRQRRRRRRTATAFVLAISLAGLSFGIIRHLSGGGRVAGSTPRGLFVNRRAFAGHGVLAFVSRGRLFVLDGRTSKLTAVTTVGQRASDPRFSPDGDWLAYTLGAARVGLARADGSSPQVVSADGGGLWLPDDKLLLRTGVFRIDDHGKLVRLGSAPNGPVGWSPEGDRFAFVSRTITHGRRGSVHGVERLQVASSLSGRRTTWRTAPISFTPRSGFRGNVINGFVVLPHRRGILFWIDPGQSASLAADGMSVYLLRSPRAQPVKLAVTVGNNVSAAPDGMLAIGAGANRYAWINKHVETCSAAILRCTPLRASAGALTIDPAWSPDGKTLAFVQAAAEPEGDFRQPTIARWYRTHHLWLLRAGSSKPTEVTGTQGASSPVWSSDGKRLLYVSGDALWLIPQLAARPVKIASPLYPPNAWPSYYGQVAWAAQFAWSSESRAGTHSR